MKGANLKTALIVGIVGVFASYYGFNAVMGDQSKRSEKVTMPTNVSGDLAAPDPEVFNPSAVNPTVEVYIGSCIDSNQNGFLEPIEQLECATPDSRRGVNIPNDSSKSNNNQQKTENIQSSDNSPTPAQNNLPNISPQNSSNSSQSTNPNTNSGQSTNSNGSTSQPPQTPSDPGENTSPPTEPDNKSN